jgi:hypothetical protein
VKVVLDHFEPGWTIRAHRYDFTNVPGAESNDNDASIHDWRIPNPTFSVDTPFDVWSTGEDWVEGTMVTVNIDDPSNGPGADYTDSTVVERWGPEPWEVGFSFHTEPFEIHPEFVVTVDDGSTVKILEVVDITVETVDEVADTVSGYAPPGERVEVHAGDEFSHAHRSVDADATTGYWMAAFSVPGEEGHEQEILDIQPGIGGAAEVPDDDGDSTHQGWCFECEGPVVTNVLADPNPAPVDTAIAVSANVDDTGTGNSNITDAEYSLNGTWAGMAPLDGSFNSPSEDVWATLSGFSEAGVHEVCVRGTDAAGNTSSGEDCTLLAVYDPSAGFVTGGGWIWSEAGWCQLDEACAEAEGKANFGFVSKYKKGASVPTGQTEFQFKAGGLNFHSSSYDWLVVAGANAKYKGVGTINGDGEYKFMLTATDADVNDNDSHQVDLFRIKIWYEADGSKVVVYDNQLGELDDGYAGTAIGGGNIKVHNGK